MKVLWFTNTPCSASEILEKTIVSGGWLSSLEKELWKRDDLDLSICFYTDRKIEPFRYEKTSYHPVFRRSTSTKIRRYWRRLIERSNGDPEELKLILQVVEAVKPDIIHVHGTEDNFGLIQKHTSLPVVISIQGLLNPILENYFSGVPFSIVRKYEGSKVKVLKLSFLNFYNQMKVSAIRELEILKEAKYIIGRTDWDKKITRLLAPHSKYFKVNEILRDSFYNKKWEKQSFDEEFKIITVTNSNIFKGFETIVKTAAILQKLTDLNFKWLVVGIDEKSQSVKIVREWLNVDLKLLNIELLGSKNEEELSNLLSSSDIYCQVSHIENSSNSLCESLLIGIPTIATYVGGTASFIQDSVNAFLVSDGNSYELSSKIIFLKNNLKLALTSARLSRSVSMTRHDKVTIIEDLLSAYQSILNQKIIALSLK